MNVKMRVSTKARLLAGCALLAMVAFGSNANASVVRIHFGGAAGSGYADLTVGPAGADDVVDPSHPPMAITDATGTFSGAAITGVQPQPCHAAPWRSASRQLQLVFDPGVWRSRRGFL